MRSPTMLMLSGLLVLSGCHPWGHSGGGNKKTSATTPAPVTITADLVTLSGQAVWPGATSLVVKIDGTLVTVTNGVWSHRIDLRGATSQTLQVAMVVDGTTVSVREVTVSR